MVEKSKLDDDKEGKVVDPSHYRGMIGTLLYPTANRPDLQFAICMCARYQARPAEKHLHVVKRIFQDLRGTVNWGLWFSKDYSIALTAFADADHAGCQDTRRSTSGSLQFLGDRLISWSKHIDIRYHFIKEHVENGVIELYFVNTEYQLANVFTKALGRERIEFLINKLDKTMDITIDQQVALDEALVPHASRIRNGKSNFQLRSDLKSKESTLQVVYDVLKLTLFYKAFLVTTNQFDELPFEEEILAFLRELGHSREIKMITDANINILPQPWRSFAAVIKKCLRGKSTGYDSLRLSPAQVLWGMYHKKNVDFAYLLWEDFVYQVEHKDVKKSNEMYYPRFTKVIVNFFMTKDQSIPRRNTVNWHYARDDHMFTTIKLVSKHQNTQQYGVILPVELTNEAIRNSKSYKEYYAIASGAEPLKTKASVRKKQSSSDTTDEQIKLATKRSLTKTYISHASRSGADEGTDIILGVLDLPNYESGDEEISWKSSEEDDDNNDDKEKISKHDDDVEDQSDDDQDEQDGDDDQDNDEDEQTDSNNDGDDFVHPKFSTHDEEAKDEESFDPIVRTPSHDDEDNDEDSNGMNVEGDEGANEEDDADELYKDLNINLEGRDIQMADVQTTQVIEDTHVTLTSVNPEDQQQSSSVSSRIVSNMLNPSPDTGIDSIFDSTLQVDVSVTTGVEPLLLSTTTLPPPTISIIPHVQQTPAPLPANVPSLSLQDLPNFGSLFGFGHRLKTLETNFSEFMQTNQFFEVVSSIPSIVDKYIDHRMNKVVKVAVRLQSDRLQNEGQAKNEDFLKKLDENIQKIIREQVKEQVKVQVSKILPKIKKTVNDQLEAEVLTHSSNSSKTSYAVAVDLSELELKKILIKKMEQQIASESAPVEEPMHSTQDLEEPAPQEFKTGATDDQHVEETFQHPHCNMAKKADSRISFNELIDTFVDFSAFVMNQLKVDTLTPELLAGLTYELMKGSCKSLVELEFFLEEVYKATTNQLDWNNPEGQQYLHNLLKPLPLIPNS
uniref:Uncharacterized mitochondrial protein AtMg00810-like n=1 Tax=Tanacetum cinerariifolium TaxID=118510 RepID=A0A6L2M7Y5_TANCI|nr:uncharacterized mitochondrial protein AtMg00810-like [Tanacetum cinerariifolium]